MEGLFTLENLFTLGMLIMLQAVLGFDNLLYISLESQRVEAHKQSKIRKWGIGLAVLLRILLLFTLLSVLEKFTNTLFHIDIPGVVSGSFNLKGIVVLLGGIFLLYTAMKEIFHLIMLEEDEHKERKPTSYFKALTAIVLMNVIFSFDSILSAMALTKNFVIMATAILIGGLLMILLADKVTEFLKKNRMYEVVGLFILFLVGVMLLSEGAHDSHLTFFDHVITPMSKATFYFVIVVMIIVDIVQSRYQRKLIAQKQKEQVQLAKF